MKKKPNKLLKHFKQYGALYFFLIPGLILVAIFNYAPMAGIVIAFKNYDIFAGRTPVESIIKSEWVGFAHFKTLFSNSDFTRAFRNTLIISTYKIVFLFPIPIILAIMITDIKALWYKKVIQTILYLPHFLSWIVVTALFLQILGPYGVINNWLKNLNIIEQSIAFFGNNDIFRGLVVISAGWKEVGWNAIIYIAAITGINPQLYEAAKIDGASKMQQVIYITIPSIANTIIMLFILRIGAILDAGFDQIFNMYSYVVYDKGDILSTLVYRSGIGDQNYSFATAVGLFNSVVALVMVLGGNYLSRKIFKKGLW
ncbi:MAG TPA: ABC transporter permease subunit [Bacilli bacterium]|nr:MAG: putative multiple-sugar transport system permease YteP [Tenericutes bacterium ADurb.BinA124]HNZ50527.1 ABC transporter permease subunit [Bacilli bacterium]HOH17807.1 ABC transporter permease subunit [Bacilli bacterium]HPX83671.1 ABC transporter permease subunit [Bacilli bacterium]